MPGSLGKLFRRMKLPPIVNVKLLVVSQAQSTGAA